MAPNGELDRYTCTSTNSIESTTNLNDRLYLYIDGQWYDLTQWQFTHPGGSAIFQYLNRRDATDVFYSIHGVDAIEKLSHLNPCSSLYIRSLLPIIESNDITLAFRQLRENLIRLGYFNRSMFWDMFYYSTSYFLCIFGTFCHFYWDYYLLAILMISIGMQQAVWIGHDYTHTRGTIMRWLCWIISGFINGFSPSWWSKKHNMYHTYTSYTGINAAIISDPILHLCFPLKDDDGWPRTYQQWYFVPIYSFIHISWRWQSFQYSFDTANYLELMLMLPNYIWLSSLGWRITLGSILLAGLFVSLIVTATHQSEQLLVDSFHSFVETQFLTIHSFECNNFFMEWICGGMQYQLEHHLFPTMPKYNFVYVRPILRQWASENGIQYRYDSVESKWCRHYRILKYFRGKMTNSK